MEEQQQSPIKHALRFGAIIGIASTILTFLLYIIDADLMVNMIFGVLIFIAFIVLVIIGGRNYRNKVGGYLDFGPAFLHGFIVFLTIGVISTSVNLLMYNVIDTNLSEVHTDAIIDQTESMMRWMRVPEDSIEDAFTDEKLEEISDGFKVSSQLFGFVKSSIFFAVVSLITGLIVRKQEKFSDVV